MSNDTNNNNKIYSRQTTATEFDFHIVEEVGDANEYIDMNQVLLEATENDTINIRINNRGGSVSTGIQLANNIFDTKAATQGILNGVCYSAATFLFLACDSWEVKEGSHLMIHHYSAGHYGKGQDLVDATIATHDWIVNYMTEIYKGFLTDEEIKAVTQGNTDIWMETDEIIKRLHNLVEYRKSIVEQYTQAQEEEMIAQAKQLIENSSC